MKLFSICAFLLFSLPASAGPPQGHPSIDETAKILNLPQDESPAKNSGRVLIAVNSNNYTYIKVENGGVTTWIAAPRLQIRLGTIIHYPEGRAMKNFYSKRLKHLFPLIIFVARVEQQI